MTENAGLIARASALAAVEEAKPTAAGDFERCSKTSGGARREPDAIGRGEELRGRLTFDASRIPAVVSSEVFEFVFFFLVALQTSTGVRT